MCIHTYLVWLNRIDFGFVCSLLNKFESDQGPCCLFAYLWSPASVLEPHHCSLLIVQVLSTVP